MPQSSQNMGKYKKHTQVDFKQTIERLFPLDIGSPNASKLFRNALNEVKNRSKGSQGPWIRQKMPIPQVGDEIFNHIPETGIRPEEIIRLTITRFIRDVPNWRDPNLQYNICAPVNSLANAMLALGQELNIHNINTDFSGNCLEAENAISTMLADLVNLDRKDVRALFSFGGTASNMYAMKISLNKAYPEIGITGIPKNVYIFISANSHFSHKTVADWMGLGMNQIVVMDVDKDNRSLIAEAELKAKVILKDSGVIAGFLINGGPFYDFAIDDIHGFVKMRNNLVREFKLKNTPHIHVDSVIGWIWLIFNKYDFQQNPLNISKDVLEMIKKQYDMASQIRYADSWGVDFHKGLGGCPTPCGVFVSNSKYDINVLSKKFRGICDTHHLGGDWSSDDPSDITLETSRSAGPPLAALGSLLSMGKNGYRQYLANLMLANFSFRRAINQTEFFIVGNLEALGFNTMVVILPKRLCIPRKKDWHELLAEFDLDDALRAEANGEIKEFYEYCLTSGDGKSRSLGCSFSKNFQTTSSGKGIAGLKYCIVSPYSTASTATEEVARLSFEYNKFLEFQQRRT